MAKPKQQEWPRIELERKWRQGHREEMVNQGDDGKWRVTDLWHVVKDEPVFEVPLAFLPLKDHGFTMDHGLHCFAKHMKHVMECDLDHPVIFDEYGSILDGRHRIVKAMLEGRSTIRAVRVPPGYSTTMPR